MYKNRLRFKDISVRDLCMMAMLIALTMILSTISGYLRIGDSIKFSISFISVYIGAAFYGPIAGGAIAAIADIISFVMNPTGPYIPVFTVMEFVNGCFFGLLLYREVFEKKSISKIVVLALICSLMQFLVNMFWRTYELSRMYNFPFWIKFLERLPANIIMVICKVVVISILEPHMSSFKKMILRR